MRGTILNGLRAGASKLLRDQRGNAMMLTAAAIIPVIGIVGSAVDIGRAYMAQLRLQQACDAGVLAGRRAMAGGSYGDPQKAEANKMFNFNYPTAMYGSTGISFSSVPVGTSSVGGTAAATLPTLVMTMFGKENFALSVNCEAKLEISSTDVMLVLDVTGSMDDPIADNDAGGGATIAKIAALRNAANLFMTTITSAERGDGRLRIGVVPYSGTVNVGAIMQSSWIADTVTVPSRQPNTAALWTTTGNTSNNSSTNPSSWSGWSATQTINNTTNANCTKGSETITGTASTTVNGPNTSGDTRTTTTTTTTPYTDYQYRNQSFNSSTKVCTRQYRSRTYSSSTVQTKTEKYTYTYLDRTFDVSSGKNMSTSLSFNTGTAGASQSAPWTGCVMERATNAFASNAAPPANTYDMDIDLVPTANDDTKWRMFIPYFVYSRSSPTNVNSTTNSTNFGKQSENFGDTGACPVPVMKLTNMDDAGKTAFTTKINGLKAQGYTYHDSGMAWGARLISPDGLFAAENGNYMGRPVGRHIIFMTDGEMKTPRTNYSHQGLEQVMQRIGATDNTDAIARHTNRLSYLCAAAKQKGIVVWIIGFGVDLDDAKNAKLVACASSGKAYEAGSSAQLASIFSQIAQQISRLRLSQ